MRPIVARAQVTTTIPGPTPPGYKLSSLAFQYLNATTRMCGCSGTISAAWHAAVGLCDALQGSVKALHKDKNVEASLTGSSRRQRICAQYGPELYLDTCGRLCES